MQGGHKILATIIPEKTSYGKFEKGLIWNQHAGGWKLDAVAEGYLENLRVQKNEQMSMLSTKEKK
eukprot:4966753-Ditylum_brightwellii.AAC.1